MPHILPQVVFVSNPLSRSGRHPTPQVRLVDHLGDRGSYLFDARWRHQCSLYAMANEFRNAGDARCNTRNSQRHRFH
jgi:hypothetical protein